MALQWAVDVAGGLVAGALALPYRQALMRMVAQVLMEAVVMMVQEATVRVRAREQGQSVNGEVLVQTAALALPAWVVAATVARVEQSGFG